jgi:hypothetical protein
MIMNRNVVFGIAGIVLGAIGAYVALQLRPAPPPPPPSPAPLVRACPLGFPAADRCAYVDVVTVDGALKIAEIPDIQMSAQGTIWWFITTAGYTFPANGIDFANPGPAPKVPAPSSVIDPNDCKPMPPNDSRFKCVNKHPTGGGVKYAYKVTLTGTPPVNPSDPFVVNN